MYKTNGLNIEMSVGDYGVPMPFRVRECCAACAQDILGDDVFRLTVSRAGRELVSRNSTWADMEAKGGVLELTLTKEESAALPLGLCTWRLQLIREDEVRNTVAWGPFFVGVGV